MFELFMAVLGYLAAMFGILCLVVFVIGFFSWRWWQRMWKDPKLYEPAWDIGPDLAYVVVK